MIYLVPKDEQVLIVQVTDHVPCYSDPKYFFIVCHIRLLKKHILQTCIFGHLGAAEMRCKQNIHICIIPLKVDISAPFLITTNYTNTSNQI